MNKTKEFQQIIRLYKQRTDCYEVDMRKVAEFAAYELGVELPKPVDPLDLLARKFTSAAREETRIDAETGLPYRANHAVPKSGSQQCLWIDIDEAPRALMQKSAVKRREQIVGDALQLELDVQHWNRVNHLENPINIPLDFTEDVEERINSQRYPTEGDADLSGAGRI